MGEEQSLGTGRSGRGAGLTGTQMGHSSLSILQERGLAQREVQPGPSAASDQPGTGVGRVPERPPPGLDPHGQGLGGMVGAGEGQRHRADLDPAAVADVAAR